MLVLTSNVKKDFSHQFDEKDLWNFGNFILRRRTVKKIFSTFVITTFFSCQIILNNLISSDNLLFWVSDD